MKVENMTNDNFRAIPNQFIITNGGCSYFQSYDSVIARIGRTGKVTLDKKYWDYSVTTGRHRNSFLGEKKPETEAKIKSGEYALADLNSKKGY